MKTTRLPHTRRHHHLLAAAVLSTAVLVPVLLAGCSSAPPAASPPVGGSGDVAAVGQCVRDRGYDVDDSDFSAPGRYAQPDGLSPDEAEAYSRTVEACAAGTSVAAPSSDGAISTEFEKQLLALSACLRDAGFTDVADPVDGVWRPDPSREDDPAYQTATATCQEQVGLQSSR